MQSRSRGRYVIYIIGAAASVYAVFLYGTGKIAPDAPSRAHDAILQTRWSSPLPSSNIVIVDIDERSLALLAPEYGRWPWPRSVLADGLQKIQDAGASAVLFNILLTDPDKANPDADAAMEVTAAMATNAAFPVIRLNPINDRTSQLTVQSLLQITGDAVASAASGSSTVAVLLPLFGSMQQRMGIANQSPDSDGAVRRYPLQWVDSTLAMPSIVARTIQVSGRQSTSNEAKLTLNWRNKKGRYKRISFGDLLDANVRPDTMLLLKDAFVVMGASAPGIGQTKGTAVSAVEDDNEILATALDDALNDTHLRTLPDWLVLGFQVGAVWLLVWIGLGGSLYPFLNTAFFGVQSASGFITLASASYTKYLIDLTGVMTFGAGVFAAIKIVQTMDARWSRAKPGIRRAVDPLKEGSVLLIAYRDDEVTPARAAVLQQTLESQLGVERVIRIDDLFGGENFLRPACELFSAQLCLFSSSDKKALLAGLESLEFSKMLSFDETPLSGPWDPDDSGFRQSVTPRLLRLCADVLSRQPLAPTD